MYFIDYKKKGINKNLTLSRYAITNPPAQLAEFGNVH